MVEKTEYTSIGQFFLQKVQTSHRTQNFFDGNDSCSSILDVHFVSSLFVILYHISLPKSQDCWSKLPPTGKLKNNYLINTKILNKVSNVFRVCITNNCLLSIAALQVMQCRVRHAEQQFLKSAICQFGEPNWFYWAGLSENSTKSKRWSTKNLFKIIGDFRTVLIYPRR